MHQYTCHILPWLRQVSSPEIATDLAEHFNVVGAIKAVSFVGVGGLERLGVLQLRPHTICVITGRLGKTRALETVKRQAGEASPLQRPSVHISPEQSAGQTLKSVLFALLQVQPEGSALLVDDVLDSVDAATAREVLGLLAHHDKQVILSVRPRMVEMVRAGCPRVPILAVSSA